MISNSFLSIEKIFSKRKPLLSFLKIKSLLNLSRFNLFLSNLSLIKIPL